MPLGKKKYIEIVCYINYNQQTSMAAKMQLYSLFFLVTLVTLLHFDTQSVSLRCYKNNWFLFTIFAWNRFLKKRRFTLKFLHISSYIFGFCIRSNSKIFCHFLHFRIHEYEIPRVDTCVFIAIFFDTL